MYLLKVIFLKWLLRVGCFLLISSHCCIVECSSKGFFNDTTGAQKHVSLLSKILITSTYQFYVFQRNTNKLLNQTKAEFRSCTLVVDDFLTLKNVLKEFHLFFSNSDLSHFVFTSGLNLNRK